MNASPSVLLSVTHLVKHFPARAGGGNVVRAVDDVSFDLSAGETLALVGESGCGKSTTGRLVLRLMNPSSGLILFNSADIAHLRGAELLAYRRQAQIIFQDPFSSLNPRMTVEQIVREPLVVHGLTHRTRVHELLRLVGLNPDHAHRYPHEFSGGQRQRIGIARALSLQPKLIVCDEPVSALDVSVQAQIINLLADLQQQLGVAYLFISHNLAVVRQVSHRVAVMYLGRVVELSPEAALFDRPLHPYTALLIAAVPEPDPTLGFRDAPIQGELPSPLDPPPGCPFHPRCPIADSRCGAEPPAFREAAPGRYVRCHKPGEFAPKGTR